MVDTLSVVKVMGGPSILSDRVRSIFDLSKAVSGGLPKAALRNTLQRIFPAPGEARSWIHRVVPEATFKRRTRLTATESERTERLARVIAYAEYVWDNTDDAHVWLTHPHPELEDKSPIECAMTELGARQVEEVLGRLFYGLPA